MPAEDNKAIARRFIEEVWNQGNVSVVDELMDPNFVHHDPASPHVSSREDYKQWIAETRTSFPDCHITIEDLIEEGDRVVTRWTIRGTHKGAIISPMHIPATGKQIAMAGMTITRAFGAKAVEDWHSSDALGLMQQLGMIPTTR